MNHLLPLPRLFADRPRLPVEAQRDGTAGRLLAAALALFAQRGYHATSIRDIGDELGLKAGVLYDHFPSKEHLLAELVRAGHVAHQRLLQRALIASGPGPVEQLRSLVRAHVWLHAEYAMLTAVATRELHALSPALAAPALALREQSEALFRDVISRGVDERVFDVVHAGFTVAAIGAMGPRVAGAYRSDRDLDPVAIAELHAELAVRMVTIRKDTTTC
jgi:AcrR family transcriptional regulator